MLEPIHLSSAASAAHALALELYRFTARWPECDREGLTLDVRRAGHDLSSCLACADEGVRTRDLRRAVHTARRKHARLRYLLHFASDLGYRKLSTSARVEELMDQLYLDLDLLTGESEPEARLDGEHRYPDAVVTPARRARRKKPRGRTAANHAGRKRPDY